MPAGLTYTIPAAWNSLDEHCYLTTSGAPSDAHVLRELFANDRLLHAQLRRQLSTGFPYGSACSTTSPTISDLCGTDLGVHYLPWTYGARWVRWHLRMELDLGAVMYAVPYTEGDYSPRPWMPLSQALQSSAFYSIITGTGAMANYTVADCPAWPGSLYGLILYAVPDTASIATGTVAEWNPRAIRANATGAFAGIGLQAPPLPPAGAICLTLGAAGAQISPWYTIRSVQASGVGGAVNDLVYVHPEITRADWTETPPQGTAIGWAVAPTSMATIRSILPRELELTGTLRTEAW